MFCVIQLFVFVIVFGQIVHRTIRIRPYSLKPLFGTSLLILVNVGVLVLYMCCQQLLLY